MIIVNLKGGLGNQMFQYALYRNFLERGEDVYYEGLEIHKFYPEYEAFPDFSTTENILNIHLYPITERTWTIHMNMIRNSCALVAGVLKMVPVSL